ncbi:hypothetical protein LTR24_008282 [Lithohypha guttulata]|uniref:Uncharacterized protein n=1 Tax=Lithohypha guttulata TaxID=1690604 RepID=A0ABR0K0X7_9EURO|nr:hypothetical protein LTR24_008282 [Lithohypha guttulata]
MAVFSQAIRRFLYGGHDEPVERKPYDRYKSLSSSQLKDDARLQKDVFMLTIELLALKQDIDDAEEERERIGGVLLPHRKRLQVLVERYQHMKTFFVSQDEEDNVELAVARINRLESGIEEIDQRLSTSAEAISQLRSVHDGIIRKMMKRTKMRSVRGRRPSGLDDQPLITERMIRRNSLEVIENQAAEVEDYIETEATEQLLNDGEDNDDARSFTSEDAERQEKVELMKRLGQLKSQRTDLEEDPTAATFAADAIQTLTRQINDLGDEIAIRGTPCVEGSIIFQDEFDDCDSHAEQVSAVHIQDDVNNASDVAAGPSQEAILECAGPGLFNGVLDIEAPENMSQSGDEKIETDAKKAERMQRMIKRVAVWASQLEAGDEQLRCSSDKDIPDAKFEGVDQLQSIMVGESDSVYHEDSSDYADPDVQEAHPRGLVTK